MNSVSLRPMRLKVLYTFDEQSKTNCLARWPHVVHIQTVELDEATCVGVIELKTCIQAVVSASPELVANLGQDYTVYAYDYSEYDTPLVGQGMLSWALASASSASGASTPSRAVITGRVTKNIFGLFSNGGAETLEVKLRLLPVARCLQSEFINSMDTYRELSRTVPSGLDMGAWTSFLKSNPGLRQSADNHRVSVCSPGVTQRNDFGMETLSQIMSHGVLPTDISQNSSNSVFQETQSPGAFAASICQDLSRTASPAHDRGSGAGFSLIQDQLSRPVSQASTRTLMNPLQTEITSVERNDGDGEDPRSDVNLEDGPSKKRARITKTDWNGRASIGASSESLRVAASTAASMRILRPIAIKPSDARSASLEEPPRQPTPRPEASGKPRRGRGRPPSRSRLSDPSSGPPRPSHTSWPPLQQKHAANISPTMPSVNPEDGGFANSPVDIASSPPTLEQGLTMPSSPVLPTLPRLLDSGFMSGPVDDLPEDENEMRPIDKEDLEVAAQYSKRTQHPQSAELTIEEVTPGPPELLPTRILPRHVVGQKKKPRRVPSTIASEPIGHTEEVFDQTALATRKPTKRGKATQPPALDIEKATSLPVGPNKPLPPSRGLTRTPSIGGPILPAQAASDPVVPLLSGSNQSGPDGESQQSKAVPQVQDGAASTTQAGSDKTSLPRSGSGAKRKKAIQKRLAIAIESGEMPPFCENCGAIETPTWRKAWSKKLEGSSEDIKLSDEEGGVLAIREVQKDKEGNVTSFSILKKSLLETDQDFTEIQLCNPCGLWFQKFKCMRPEERWNKETRDPNDKKKRTRSRKKVGSAAPVEGIAASASPEGTNSQSDNTAASHAYEDDPNEELEGTADDGSLCDRLRATSAQPRRLPANDSNSENITGTAAALKRFVQSSPARALGTQCSPIDVDDLGSTRRILFPSPKKADGSKPLQDITASANIYQARQPSAGKSATGGSPSSSDKENCLVQTSQDDDLAELFEDAGDDDLTTPRKQTSIRSSDKSSKKSTPCRRSTHGSSPWRFDLPSTNEKEQTQLLQTPSTRNRSPRSGRLSAQHSPFTAQMYRLLSEANVSPSANDFDFSTLPTLGDLLPLNSAGNTPSRASNNGVSGLCHPAEMFSTDIPTPSSPPGFFSLYEDPPEPASELWSEFEIPGSPLQSGVGGIE